MDLVCALQESLGEIDSLTLIAAMPEAQRDAVRQLEEAAKNYVRVVESGALCRAQPELQWPRARDVARLEDMSPHGHMRVLFDRDNDVLVEVFDGENFASIEFGTPGLGGGQSSQTRLALIGVMRAIEADNVERPSRAHPRFK